MKTRKVRECTANDQFLVAEGTQCGNCLGLNGKHNKPIVATERNVSEAKHSPTPWNTAVDQYGRYKIISVKTDKEILMTPENAAFTVRAVNSHEELLEASRIALAELEREAKITGSEMMLAAVANLKYAIAKAEGKLND